MWGLSVLRRNNSANKLKRAIKVAIEPLESRVMMSIAPGTAVMRTTPVDGTLWVRGTQWADTITLGVNAGDSSLVDVNVNGTLFQFNASEVNYIFVNALGGKDYVKVDETNGVLPVGVTFKGGLGADRLIGGSNNDALAGADGNDYLVGGGGNDWIVGAGGNDKMWGGLGSDTIKGAAGNDWVVGGYGNDVLYGDGGNDNIDSGEGADTFYGGYGNNNVNNYLARGVTSLVDRGTADYSGANLAPGAVINTPDGLSVTDIRTAYEFGDLSDPLFTNRGQGQAVAIVIAYDIPTAAADLSTFSDFYGLTNDPARFQTIYASGAQPIQDPSGTFSWDTEADLDIQWVHAIAPEATIYLVEADSNSFADINVAIRVAAQTLVDKHGGGVVNMSLGSYVDQGGEIGSQQTEAIFKNPAFEDVSFVAASGDSGARPGYPGTSPNVLSVGGTALTVDVNGNYVSEDPWTDASGGYSVTYPTPAYQVGITINGNTPDPFRASPDVAYNGDPATAVSIYTSFAAYDLDGDGSPDSGWVSVGGTSAGSPQWSGLVAVANQVRSDGGLGKIGSQLTAKIYALGSLNQTLYFNDIDTGQIGPPFPIISPTPFFQAYTGYDLASGWGTPHAQQVISGIADNAIQGAQLRGLIWKSEYKEAIEKYPGRTDVPLFADFNGNGQARVTSTQLSLGFQLVSQFNGQLLQMTFPILDIEASGEFRGVGTATIQGTLTGGVYKVAIAGAVYKDEDNVLQVKGTWDAINPITGQTAVEGAEETYRGSFTTDH